MSNTYNLRMDNFNNKNSTTIAMILATIGCGISLFMSFIGFVFLTPAIILTYKRESIEMTHAFWYSCVAIVCILIITIISFFR